jgi:hypothetical protein
MAMKKSKYPSAKKSVGKASEMKPAPKKSVGKMYSKKGM